MTLQEAKQVYSVVDPNGDWHLPHWAEDVRREMERVVTAKSDRKAGDIIRWWDCWPPGSATGTARAIREAWARKIGKP